MRSPESYWTRKGPPIPEAKDLPQGFPGGDRAFGSLSPGMRREIWRDKIQTEARKRDLPADILSRLRVATISGSLSTLDDYLMLFEREDAARSVIRDDAERLKRADAQHAQSEIQIDSRERL